MARSFKLTTALEIAVLVIFAIVMLFPVLWMLETAFKDTKDIYAVPAKVFTFKPTLSHFKDVFGSNSPIAKGFRNSVIVAGGSTLIATEKLSRACIPRE